MLPEHPNNAPTGLQDYKPVAPTERPFFLVLLGSRTDAADIFGPVMGVHNPMDYRAYISPLHEGMSSRIEEVQQDLHRAGFHPKSSIEAHSAASVAREIGPVAAIHIFDEPGNKPIELAAALAKELGVSVYRWEEGTCCGVFGGSHG